MSYILFHASLNILFVEQRDIKSITKRYFIYRFIIVKDTQSI